MKTLRSMGAAVGAAAAVTLAISVSQVAASSKAKCNASNPVKIGTIWSLSGPGAGIGKLDQQGATLAVSQVNAEGGMQGRCIKLVVTDDGTNPTTAAQDVRQLIDQERVQFIVGPFFSSNSLASMPYMNQNKIININESALPDAGDASKYPYTFRGETASDVIAEIMANFVKEKHYKRVAVLALNTALGQVLAPALQNLVPKAGATVTKIEFMNTGAPDVTPQMASLKATNPDLIIMGVTSDPDQVAAIKAKMQLGIKVPLLGFSTAGNPATVANFTKAQLNDVYAAQIYKTLTYTSTKPGQGKPTWPLAKKFVSDFAKWIHAHNIKESISQATGGYDSIRMLQWAVNGTKSFDSDKIKSWFETHAYTGVRGVYHWSATRHDGVSASMNTVAYANSLNVYGLLRQVG